MREIKFRAWHKEEGKMYDRVFVATDKSGVVTGNLWHDGEYNSDWKIWKLDYFEVMQFTGLKDKNGKEIYDGDILNGVNSFSKDRPYEVVWNQSLLRWDANSIIDPCHILYESMSKEVEIIGNIYENQELLKEVK